LSGYLPLTYLTGIEFYQLLIAVLIVIVGSQVLLIQCLPYLVSYPMEQRPSWEANQFSASQIPCILFNSKVHYRIHKWLPHVEIQRQHNHVHAPHPTSWRSIL